MNPFNERSSGEKMLKYITYTVGLASLGAVLCFLFYITMYTEESNSAYDLSEQYLKDNLATTLAQKSFDDARKASRDLDRANASKNGAELALLLFISLNIVHHVHFK
tara:strand:+ start:431 stop:751 length:321 start_codon:yes stop_codon:yes gene_type:complete